MSASAAHIKKSNPLFSFSLPMELDGWALDVDYTAYHRATDIRRPCDWPEIDLVGVRQRMGNHSVEIQVAWFTPAQQAWLREEALGNYQIREEDDEVEHMREEGLL